MIGGEGILSTAKIFFNPRLHAALYGIMAKVNLNLGSIYQDGANIDNPFSLNYNLLIKTCGKERLREEAKFKL